MSTSQYGDRWRRINSGRGRNRVRAPRGWELVGLALMVGFGLGFLSGMSVKMLNAPVVQVVQGGGQPGVQPRAEEPPDRQRALAALRRYQEEGASQEDLARLYTVFREQGWDIPEDLRKAFEQHAVNVDKLQDL